MKQGYKISLAVAASIHRPAEKHSGNIASRLIQEMTLVFLATAVGTDLMEAMMTRTTINLSANTDTQACSSASR